MAEVFTMPMVPSSLEELRARLARELEIEERLLTAEAQFVGDLRAGSVNIIVVLMALEEWFDLQIGDEEAESLLTLKDVQAFLESRGVRLQAAGVMPL